MAQKPKALPESVLSEIEGRIRRIGDSRADAMRRIVRNENIATVWSELSKAGKKKKNSPSFEKLVSTLYLAVYEAGWILQRREMMTRGEARKIAEGLELLAKYEEGFFYSTMGHVGNHPSFLLEKYSMFAQEIPTGARRRPQARSLAMRLSSIFREAVGKPCHEATAALIRAAHGGECDAETVRTYVSSGGPKRM